MHTRARMRTCMHILTLHTLTRSQHPITLACGAAHAHTHARWFRRPPTSCHSRQQRSPPSSTRLSTFARALLCVRVPVRVRACVHGYVPAWMVMWRGVCRHRYISNVHHKWSHGAIPCAYSHYTRCGPVSLSTRSSTSELAVPSTAPTVQPGTALATAARTMSTTRTECKTIQHSCPATIQHSCPARKSVSKCRGQPAFCQSAHLLDTIPS